MSGRGIDDEAGGSGCLTTSSRAPDDVVPEPIESPAPPPTAPVATSSSLGVHQPGLDGMRAVALLIVLGYHGELPWTQGGFLGVSQFFTLSGFLITGVLLRSHLSEGGNLRPFWVRRARRLMPGAFLALAGIVVFGATVATRQQLQALPGDVLRSRDLDCELAIPDRRPVVHQSVRRAVTGTALLVARDRGAVLPDPADRPPVPPAQDAQAASSSGAS